MHPKFNQVKSTPVSRHRTWDMEGYRLCVMRGRGLCKLRFRNLYVSIGHAGYIYITSSLITRGHRLRLLFESLVSFSAYVSGEMYIYFPQF